MAACACARSLGTVVQDGDMCRETRVGSRELGVDENQETTKPLSLGETGEAAADEHVSLGPRAAG